MTTCRAAQAILLWGPALASLALPSSAQTSSPPLATPAALACAPRLAPSASTPAGLVLGAPDNLLHKLFGPGDGVLLNVGRAEGVSVGTQFFTQVSDTPAHPEWRDRGIRVLRTTGWLRAVEVDEHAALAVVEQACAEVRRGDQLTPFQWPIAVSIGPAGTVVYDDPATVLFGSGNRSMLGAGQFLVIDQGTDQQIAPGQRMTIFRASPRGPQDPVTQLGEGIAMLVDAASATVQVIRTREPIRIGDLVAAQR